jgi:hypothetical protein
MLQRRVEAPAHHPGVVALVRRLETRQTLSPERFQRREHRTCFVSGMSDDQRSEHRGLIFLAIMTWRLQALLLSCRCHHGLHKRPSHSSSEMGTAHGRSQAQILPICAQEAAPRIPRNMASFDKSQANCLHCRIFSTHVAGRHPASFS